MDDAAKKRLRLDRLHDDELLRVRKTQEQERGHIALIQAQNSENHKVVLNLNHEATIAQQKALYQQQYEHSQRMLKREGRDASTQTAFEPRDSAPESERVGSKNKAVATPGELVTESEDVGPSDEAAVEPKKGFTRKADMFTEFARRAKERAGEKKGGK